MLQRTALYMKEQNMALPGERIVLGVSGGLDSVCLFHVLRTLGYELEVVHVHHGIRGAEADRDEAFVKALCKSYEIPFHGYRFDVPKLSREMHLSVEEAGRMVRRQAFFEVQEKTGASHIALAHHGNDKAETFLFHLCRGAGIRGLCSLRPVEGGLIRPLLWAKRADLESWAEEQGYRYVEDSTNAETDYTRNKIRHEILPALREVNTECVAHIVGAAQKLTAVSDYIDRQAQQLFLDCSETGEKGIELRKDSFLAGDPVLYMPVLGKALETLDGSLVNVTEEHFRQILRLFDLQTGRELMLPRNLAAVRTYDGIRLFLREEQVTPEAVEITGEGIYSFGDLTITVSLEEWGPEKNFPRKNYTKCFDYDKIKSNVFLRTRSCGDYLEINRDHGRKSLQDYMVNEKIPKEERDRVPLLAEGSHILWVLGKRISEYYKVTENTKHVLKVQISGGNGYEELHS